MIGQKLACHERGCLEVGMGSWRYFGKPVRTEGVRARE